MIGVKVPGKEIIMKTIITINASEFNAISNVISAFNGKTIDFSELKNETSKDKFSTSIQRINDDGTVTVDIEIRTEFLKDVCDIAVDFADIAIGVIKSLKGLSAIAKAKMEKWKTSQEEVEINGFFNKEGNDDKVIACFMEKDSEVKYPAIYVIDDSMTIINDIIQKAGKNRVFYARKENNEVEVTENLSQVFLWKTSMGGKREATEETKAE